MYFKLIFFFKAGPCFRRLVSDLSPLMLGSNPRSLYLSSVLDRLTLGHVFFSEKFGFILSVSFHQCPTPIFICELLLPEGQTGEAWEPSKI